MRVTPIPCFRDNYAYLVVCPDTGRAAVVDPSDADPVLAAVAAAGVTLEALWCTHHHPDHTGGNAALLAHRPGLAVAGHASDRGRIPGQTLFLEDGDTVPLGRGVATVHHIPGHTLGAVAFVIEGEAFTGDTLFQAGCGRLFEGGPEMMFESLGRLVRRLAPETRVWCGHEYTVQNLRFALTVEPANRDVTERLAWAEGERAAGRPTVPSTMAGEGRFNVFLRADSARTFAALRSAKDGHRGT